MSDWSSDVCSSDLIEAGQIDLPYFRLARAALAGTEKLDDPAVGRPGWRFVLPTIGEQMFTAARRRHHTDAEIARDLCKGDQITARAPFGRRIAAAAEADPVRVRTVRVHDIQLLPTRSVAFEYDLSSIRRVAAANIDTRRNGQAFGPAAICRPSINVSFARSRHGREHKIGRADGRAREC